MRSVLFWLSKRWLRCLPELGISRFGNIFTVHTNLEIEGVIRVTDKGGRVVLSMNVGNQPLLMLISAPLQMHSRSAPYRAQSNILFVFHFIIISFQQIWASFLSHVSFGDWNGNYSSWFSIDWYCRCSLLRIFRLHTFLVGWARCISICTLCALSWTVEVCPCLKRSVWVAY